jgi:FlaA1/EpsC-like NDP-sugar epimerase
VYVLEMGEQIKVLDMARNLIRLAGYVPEHDIPIVIVGLRPGEKLFEELVEANEYLQLSGVEKIFLVQARDLPKPAWLAQKIGQLESLARQGAAKEVVECLCELVPTYRPQPSARAEDSHEYPGYPTRHCGPCREPSTNARAATS